MPKRATARYVPVWIVCTGVRQVYESQSISRIDYATDGWHAIGYLLHECRCVAEIPDPGLKHGQEVAPERGEC